MATQEWLSPKTAINSLINKTLFNNFICLNRQSLDNLSYWIFKGLPGAAGYFTKAEDWISSIVCIPIDGTILKSGLGYGYVSIGPSFLGPPEVDEEHAVKGIKLATNSFYLYMGEWKCDLYQGNFDFIDYNGFTQIEVFLPYYGFVELAPNDIQNKYVQFRLKYDPHNGNATYFIGVTDKSVNFDDSITPVINNEINNPDSHTRIIGIYNFKLGYEIPLGTSNASDIKRTLALSAISMGGNALIGITKQPSVTTIASSGSTTTTAYRRKSPTTGRLNITDTWTKVEQPSEKTISSSSDVAHNVTSDCFNTSISALNNASFRGSTDKPNDANMLANCSDHIRIVVKRPKFQRITPEFAHQFGLPLGTVHQLVNLSGFTTIKSIHLEGKGFEEVTDAERNEIKKLLEEGIIL